MGTSHNTSEIYLWDITSQKVSAVLEDEKMSNISNIDFSENGYHMLSSSNDNNIVNLWDLRKQDIIKSIEIPNCQSIKNVEFDYIGKYIAISSGDSYIYNTKSNELINLDDTKECNFVKFDRDMEYILSISCKGDMNINLICSN